MDKFAQYFLCNKSFTRTITKFVRYMNSVGTYRGDIKFEQKLSKPLFKLQIIDLKVKEQKAFSLPADAQNTKFKTKIRKLGKILVLLLNKSKGHV